MKKFTQQLMGLNWSETHNLREYPENSIYADTMAKVWEMAQTYADEIAVNYAPWGSFQGNPKLLSEMVKMSVYAYISTCAHEVWQMLAGVRRNLFLTPNRIPLYYAENLKAKHAIEEKVVLERLTTDPVLELEILGKYPYLTPYTKQDS